MNSCVYAESVCAGRKAFVLVFIQIVRVKVAIAIIAYAVIARFFIIFLVLAYNGLIIRFLAVE